MLLSVISVAQSTATDFMVDDCNGVTHSLFDSLDAGNIIVIAWVMPCGACAIYGKYAYDAAYSFALSHPGSVDFYLVDDYANTSCSNLVNWGNSNQMPLNTDIIIGGNIGKNKLTPNEDAVNDYEICFEKLFPYVDYFAVNVSSPNTPGLRDLQDKEPLTALLNRLQELNALKDTRKPILLKLAPDLTDNELDDIISIIINTRIDGVIATNTTINMTGLKTGKDELMAIGNGGLSGKPLKSRSTQVIRYLADKSNKAFPIIGVGGICSAEDAIEKLDAGADLVQIYSGLIYEGPMLVRRINEAILKR